MDRRGEIPPVQDHHLAGHEIHGYGDEGRGQLLERSNVCHRKCCRTERELHVLAGDDPRRKSEFPPVEADLESGGDPPVGVFETERLVAPGRSVGEQVLPVQRLQESLQLLDAHARRIEPPDGGPDARSRDVVHGNPELLKNLEDADVGPSLRPATAEHETDLGAGGIRSRTVVQARPLGEGGGGNPRCDDHSQEGRGS